MFILVDFFSFNNAINKLIKQMKNQPEWLTIICELFGFINKSS